MTSFLGRWPDFTNSDSLLLVTVDGTQLQVTGALADLGAMTKIEAYDKIRGSGSNLTRRKIFKTSQGGGLRRGLMI